MTPFAQLAPHYWKAGLPAMPLRPSTKIPVLPGWDQFCDRMPSTTEIGQWLAQYAGNNLGLPLGPQSQIFIIDIDATEDALISLIEETLPPTPWRRVGAKGCALAYRWHDGIKNFKLKDQAGKMAVEGLGRGQQIVLPGSIHPDTRRPYEANCNLWEVLEQLPVLPDDIELQLRQALGVGPTVGVKADGIIKQGSRHTALASQAGRLFNAGIRGNDLFDALWNWNLKNCAPPQDREDVAGIVASAEKGWECSNTLSTTDMSNAARLANRLRGRACLVTEAKVWFFFDGQRWKRDPGNLIAREAKAAAQDIYREALARNENLKGAARCQSASALKNMVALAESEEAMLRSVAEFDVDRSALNTPSGVVNLRTGERHQHSPEKLFLQMTTAPYETEAQCPKFMAFLAQILPSDEERAFLQRFIGYCLTGLNSEQKFLIASGAGANGKSTLLQAVSKAMGDYAKSTTMSTFLHRASGAATNDLAALMGARLVIANEGNRGQRLDTALLKQMVGGDPINARFLHKEFFTYTPTYKPIMVSNHLPEIDPLDGAIWRRILVLPFKQSFLGSEDHELSTKLEAELPGILRWAIEGAASWFEIGLQAPASITEATNSYRSELDIIGSFISQQCIEGADLEVGATTLYHAFVNYCRATNSDVMTQTLFGRELTNRKYPEKKNDIIYRRGIALKPLSLDVAA